MIDHEPTEITTLKKAIRTQHGCESHYVRTVRVDETKRDIVVNRFDAVPHLPA